MSNLLNGCISTLLPCLGVSNTHATSGLLTSHLFQISCSFMLVWFAHTRGVRVHMQPDRYKARQSVVSHNQHVEVVESEEHDGTHGGLHTLYGRSWKLNLLKPESNLRWFKSITSFKSFTSFTVFCFVYKPFARLWSAPFLSSCFVSSYFMINDVPDLFRRVFCHVW